MKEPEKIFLPIRDGEGGINIKDVKRYQIDGASLEITVAEVRGETTHYIQGDDAKRSIELLLSRTV